VDPRPARRWRNGQPVTSTCAARLEEAARELDMTTDKPDEESAPT
jgi:hypothetical protein